MTEIHHDALDDPRLTVSLRAAGIAAIAAAALGSVLFAAPAASDQPSTGTTCIADASDNWVFRNCAGSPGADSRGVSAP